MDLFLIVLACFFALPNEKPLRLRVADGLRDGLRLATWETSCVAERRGAPRRPWRCLRRKTI